MCHLKCWSFFFQFQTFFSDASITLFEATDHKTSFGNIVIQLPAKWTDCGPEVNTSLVLPPEAAQVWIRNGSTGSVWQTEGCGQLGQGVVLQSDVFNTKRDSALRESGMLKQMHKITTDKDQFQDFCVLPFVFRGVGLRCIQCVREVPW